MPFSPLTDSQLLRAFAGERDQRAFQELVERHQDMVFSTARRRTGRDDLASDVAQQVFLALAAKAAWLSARPNIGGWLYKSTLLESTRRMRDEARRASRERRYAEEEMKLHPSSDSPQPGGEDATRLLLPQLDDAMASLPDDDREALVLRFFRGLSLRDTGAALGTTEEAARKRVSRAVEKLSALFRKRGVTASATVLAATVLPRAVDAAPASLAGTLASAGSAAPATGLGGALFLKAAGLGKPQLIAGLLAAAAVPVTWQAARIHDLSQENARLAAVAASHAPASSATAAPAQAEPPRPVPISSASEPPDAHDSAKRERRSRFEQWREIQRQQQREARLAALHEQLGLEDYQLSLIGQATDRANDALRRLREAARRGNTAVDPAAAHALKTERDQAIAEVLDAETWDEYQAFCLEEEQGRREIFANRLLADLQSTLHLTNEQKDELFAYFAGDSARAEDGRPIEMMDDAFTEKLAAVLGEEQFKLWRQRAELWAQLFRGGPDRD